MNKLRHLCNFETGWQPCQFIANVKFRANRLAVMNPRVEGVQREGKDGLENSIK